MRRHRPMTEHARKRYLILIASVVMQMCLGATYSWSVYVKPLKEITGLLQGQVQYPFSVFYFVFPTTMILSGSLLPRLGPRVCAMGGGLVFGAGWLLASLGRIHFIYTTIGIGILAGTGVGFAYIVPIATCIRWFPRQKGLVTGIAVAGFGGGAALITQAAGFLMTARGAGPFDTLAILGGVFGVLVTGAGSLMQFPPAAEPPAGEARPAGRVVGNPVFKVLYLAMFSGLAAGFTVNANLKELYPAGSAAVGITAVSVFAMANAAGRIVWGLVFDRLEAFTVIRVNLLLQALLLLAAPLLLTSDSGLLLFALAVGFNYGGVLVVYASAVAGIWGAPAVGQVYSRLFSANIPAALAPIAAGMVFDRTGSFTLPLAAIAVMLLGTALLVNHAAVRRNRRPVQKPHPER